MDSARAHARGEETVPIGEGRSNEQHLEDVAWLAETFRALQGACEGTELDPSADMRIKANDRGFFFVGSFECVGDDAGLWVDVMADHRTHARAVAIKTGERELARAWDLAAAQDDTVAEGWRRSARRVGGSTVWNGPPKTCPPR